MNRTTGPYNEEIGDAMIHIAPHSFILTQFDFETISRNRKERIIWVSRD